MVDRKISGIKRKTTAIEGTYRYFQTINRILSHFKREQDKILITKLVQNNGTLKSLLLATASIHLYHDMGIRVLETQQYNKFAYETASHFEEQQKKLLMSEFEMLLKNSFNLEIDLLHKIIKLENSFLNLLINERSSDLSENEKVRQKKELDEEIEQKLLEIVTNYPPFYFYDFIGDLIGLVDEIKYEILEESSAFKDLSIDLEKKLERDEKEDNFIELSTLDRLILRIKKRFEFKSYKELQNQAMPVRMIKRKIIEYESEKFPVSIHALRIFIEGNTIKENLVDIIDESLTEKIEYDSFENKILSFLKSKLFEQLKNNPNDFIYLLQSLKESSFDEIIFLLNTRGVDDILKIVNIDEDVIEKVKMNMVRYNIHEQDLILLNDPERNLLYQTNKLLCDLKYPYLQSIIGSIDNLSDVNIINLIYRDEIPLQKLWSLLEERLGFTINDLREFVRKKQIIEKVFFYDLNLSNYSQIILILNFDEFFNNIVKDIYLHILSKILRQYSRIIELYNKVTNDKGLYLLALTKIEGTLESEEWVNIKFEELIINRIMKRQEELVIVFSARNQVFLVNGFILSLLLNKSLKECISELKTQPSNIFGDDTQLSLKADLISPVSYCLAYDLVKRFEKFNEKGKSKVIEVIENVEKKKQEKRRIIREKQEESTFNWIERRITSANMGISRPGINPNQFYWQEKDTKILTESIKIHSESGPNPKIKFFEFYKESIDLIKKLEPNFKVPSDEQMENDVSQIIKDVLTERLKHDPSLDEIKAMVDGERFEIARRIAIKIGKILDKVLYFKFKKKRKNS
ncbi:MAG: hypothetical protein KGD66_00060 [Candidatus Lokiarchaeota archaeon]|nr:hypothetical protein [Candidatus Lokiarchaeota archaeon]